ncbi:hypothetical protein NVP3058O_051 [Vibrio phage 3.058.O._10N.286.46.B8]|nr:hypothetical protein NVP2058O_052 [Vibrio phage 2.058.O._10N.286.46.B8]AUS03121.1 hypothetical protein NVP3058O_051 [Vibrio phage 3.058.O._10N.286.46.B8]
MMGNFTEAEWEIITECIKEVEEVHYEMRKNVEQSYYVGEITADSEYWSKDNEMVAVPEKLIGLYKMDSATDLRYTNFPAALKDGGRDGWVKCKRVTVESHTYEEIE